MYYFSYWKIADLQAHIVALSAAVQACRSLNTLSQRTNCIQQRNSNIPSGGPLKQHIFRWGSGGQITYHFAGPWHENVWEPLLFLASGTLLHHFELAPVFSHCWADHVLSCLCEGLPYSFTHKTKTKQKQECGCLIAISQTYCTIRKGTWFQWTMPNWFKCTWNAWTFWPLTRFAVSWGWETRHMSYNIMQHHIEDYNFKFRHLIYALNWQEITKSKGNNACCTLWNPEILETDALFWLTARSFCWRRV